MVLLSLPLVVLLGACRGGGDDEGAGKGQRVVDPGKVATSTPIQNATLYHIQGDLVSTSGGSSTPPAGSTSTGNARNHTVASGDTCGTIASKYNTTVDELKRVNRGINEACSNLVIGDILRLPGVPTPAPGSNATATARGATGSSKEYVVKSGDTCGAIAGSFGVTVANIILANGLDQNCTLKAGQTVRIP
jgi:LysM repeat protein